MARTTQSYSTSQTERFSLKDHLYNREKVTMLAKQIAAVHPDFEHTKFINEVVKRFPSLELQERASWMVDMLEKYLPYDYRTAVGIILSALPQPLDPDNTDNDFGDFIYEPYNVYIARCGCNKKHLSFSFAALEQTTQRFSAEFALRSFVKQFEQETLARVAKWSKHKNYHVRRLASEGIRPNLPWGGKVTTDPAKIISVLDNLYYDKTRYVVRSVANNLNDISKIDCRLVLKTLRRWKKEGKQSPKEFDYLVRHALRTQIKNGESEVMDFLGYTTNIKHTITNIQYAKQVKINNVQEFSFDVTAGEQGGYLVDYVMHFNTKNGKLSEKVMKLKDITLKKGEKVGLCKKYTFRPMSTRKLYPGLHAIEIQINGKRIKKFEFDLVP